MYDEGGADYRAQSHVHRRRLVKRTGFAFPSDSAEAALPPGTPHSSGYRPVPAPPVGESSVLTQPTRWFNGLTVRDVQRRAYGFSSSTGRSQADWDRKAYGVYNVGPNER